MVIDLDSGPAVTGSVDLPVGCYPSISSWGTGGGFLAKCRDGDVTLFDADLQVVHPESFASRLGEGDLHEEDWFARPFQAGLSYVFVTDDGGVSGVTGDGVFLRGDDRARILPESTWARGMRMLDGQRTVIAFVYTRTELVPDGMVIVNTETGGVESEVAFDRPGHPFVLQSGDILLLGDGELRILPVGAEASEHVAHVHPDAEEFVD